MLNFSVSRVMTTVFAALLTMGAPVPKAQAQIGSVHTTVTLPFAFFAESRLMPAGRYELTKGVGTSFLALRGYKESAYLLMRADEGPAQLTGKLVFHRIGDQYFLQQVWFAGSGQHLICPKTRLEQQVEIAAVQRAVTQQQVAILQQQR